MPNWPTTYSRNPPYCGESDADHGWKNTKKKAPFAYAWFLKVHREMLGDVWEWAGQLRRTNKNIGIDKFQIPEALKNLEKDFQHWLATGTNPNENAARLHHRLVFIHPFENGNGRWARLITNIYLQMKSVTSSPVPV